MSRQLELPPVEDLTYWQSAGWACVWCEVRLTSNAVSAGIARGSSGAHVLDCEVFACPSCADGHTPGPDREGDDQ